MKYVYFGTPEFAAIILERLIAAGFPPALVVCNPDRPQGRKNAITPPPVKQSIMNYESRIQEQIKILQPETLINSQLPNIKGQYDFAVVAAYSKIIPLEVIEQFPKGIIGVHPSLLPRHRGPAPIQYAILEGDERIGTTLFLIDEQVDHGPIIAQQELKNYQAPTASYQLLLRQLAELSAELLIETLPKFVKGEITPIPQKHAEATFTKKIKTEDAYIPLEELQNAIRGDAGNAALFDRKIRALNPEPGVWTIQNGKRIKLLESKLENGKLTVTKIQIEGKKPRAAQKNDFQNKDIEPAGGNSRSPNPKLNS